MRRASAILMLLALAACFKNKTPELNRSVEISRVKEYTLLTLTNYSNANVDITGWKLIEEISFITTTTKEYIFQPVTIAAGASLTFSSSQLGFRLQKPDEMLYLYDKNGKLMDRMSWVSFEN